MTAVTADAIIAAPAAVTGNTLAGEAAAAVATNAIRWAEANIINGKAEAAVNREASVLLMLIEDRQRFQQCFRMGPEFAKASSTRELFPILLKVLLSMEELFYV